METLALHQLEVVAQAAEDREAEQQKPSKDPCIDGPLACSIVQGYQQPRLQDVRLDTKIEIVNVKYLILIKRQIKPPM